MEILKSRLLFIFIGITSLTDSVLSQCNDGDYDIISDDRRSAGYQNDDTDFPLCDRFEVSTGNWYRFVNTVGGWIPEATRTDCVPVQHCMTTYPIWMDGIHPTAVNDQVTRTVCANYGYNGNTGADRCCSWSAEIQVRLCPGVNGGDNFYVYQLVAPNACYASYCGGTETPPCPVDFVLENGECVEKCPIQGDNPLMSDPIQLTPPNDFEFTCSVVYPNSVNGMEKFEVTWYFNNEEDETRPRTILDANTGLTARIRGTELVGKLGQSIQCRVRSFRGEHVEFNMCSARFSNSYRMEIVPIFDGTPPLIIRDDQLLTTDIFFASTIPPVCEFPVPQCSIGQIFVTTVSDTNVRACSVNIFASDWDPTTNQAVSSTSFQVLARRDLCVDTPQNFVLHFEQVSAIGNTPFQNYAIADIQFRAENVAGGQCRSDNDPRIKTFDGRWYTSMVIGQFILVRTTDDTSPRLYEVQVRQYSCSRWTGSCNCAIAVREGRTVFGIDYCNLNNPAPVLIQYSQTVDPGAGIFTINSAFYKICMPSGACTKVYLYSSSNSRWINVYVDGLPRDMGQVTGLCGNFDGDRNNDNNIQEETHRIPEGESFFEGHIPEVTGTIEADFELCTCERDSEGNNPTLIQCGDVEPDTCQQNMGTPVEGVQLVDPTVAVPNGRRRRRRSAETTYSDNRLTRDELLYAFDYGENDNRGPDVATFPTPSGVTEAQAKQMCEDDLNTAVGFDDCLEIVGQDTYTNLVAQCVDDLRLTDNINVAGNIWEILQESCLSLAYKGVDSFGNILPRNSSTDPVNVLKQTIESRTCPDRCNDNGDCNKGICNCHSGFSGKNCAAQNGVAPRVTGVSKGGLCDVEKAPCRRTSLYNVNGEFTELDTTICKAIIAEVNHNDLSKPTRTTTVSPAAVFVSKWEIICELPESLVLRNKSVVSGFWVSLSYDGISYSSETFLTVFDSVCMMCPDGLDTCSQRENTCIIDGICYASGDPKDDDANFECRPDSDSEQWTCVTAACTPATTTTEKATTTTEKAAPTTEKATTTTEKATPTTEKATTTTEKATPTTEKATTTTEKATPTTEKATTTTEKATTTTEKATTTAEKLETTTEQPAATTEKPTTTTVKPTTTTATEKTTTAQEKTTSATATTAKETTTEKPAEWSQWSDYESCSKQCDYGLQKRSRRCLQDPCTGQTTETQVCNAFNCEENGEEKPEGVKLTVFTSVTNVALLSDKLLQETVSVVNGFCSTNTSSCCEQFIEGSLTSADVSLATLNLAKLASGYPRPANTSKAVVKVIVKVNEGDATAQCTKAFATRKKRSTTEVYLAKDVLKGAMGQNLETISENVGFKITLTDEEFEQPKEGSDIALIVGLALAGIVLLVIILSLVVYCYKKPKTKVGPNETDGDEYERPNLDNVSEHSYGTIPNKGVYSYPYSAYSVGYASIKSKDSVAKRPAISVDGYTAPGSPRVIPNMYTGDPSAAAFTPNTTRFFANQHQNDKNYQSPF